MQLASLKNKIKRGTHIRAIMGYCQGDIWIVKRLGGRQGDGWKAINDETNANHSAETVEEILEILTRLEGVRAWGTV